MKPIIPYNNILKPYARDLRINMTDCEKLLWNKIRRKQICNIQFFRQKPLGPFIVDFYSKFPKLVIELDGGQHFTEEIKLEDKKRDVYLTKLGMTILRFNNLEVLQNCEGVLWRIREEILRLGLKMDSDLIVS